MIFSILKLASSNSEFRRNFLKIAEEDSSKGSKGGKMSPDFMKFWKEVYDNGKKRVPNPNVKTKDKQRDVAASTALKDESFKKKINQEFKKWKQKNKGEKGSPQMKKLDKVLESVDELEDLLKHFPKEVNLSNKSWKLLFDNLNKVVGKNQKNLPLNQGEASRLQKRIVGLHSNMAQRSGYEEAKKKFFSHTD